MDYVIQTEQLGKQYGRHWAGKTTIMKLILGLVKKNSGKITLFQQDMCRSTSGSVSLKNGTVFKPTVFGRIDFIQEHIEPLWDAPASS